MNTLRALTNAIMSKPTPLTLASLARELRKYEVYVSLTEHEEHKTLSFMQKLDVKSNPEIEWGNDEGCKDGVSYVRYGRTITFATAELAEQFEREHLTPVRNGVSIDPNHFSPSSTKDVMNCPTGNPVDEGEAVKVCEPRKYEWSQSALDRITQKAAEQVNTPDMEMYKLWLSVDPEQAAKFRSDPNKSKFPSDPFMESDPYPSVAMKRLNTFKPAKMMVMTTPTTRGDSGFGAAERMLVVPFDPANLWIDIFGNNRKSELRNDLIERVIKELAPTKPVRVRFSCTGAIASLEWDGVQLQIDNIVMLDDLEQVLRTHLTCHK